MKQSIHAKRMARTAKRNKMASKLNLVSLMDIFTILVFFLLVNSSDVEVLQSNQEIQLPESVAEQRPENNLIVIISNESILVGGRKVAETGIVKRSKNTEINGLKEELKYLASRKPYLNEEEAKKGRNVTIMGDKDIGYDLLKKVMTTCAKSEYRNISLAVSQVPNDVTVENLRAREG
ncbi:ExbD/TolR family protein [Teredinibacter haidensis]|uniref:ExbD/TolR family protein n=1 Tax=Teredinibacter haidensis TaxID=2731755 RepID=UPI000ABC8635|nr:biopolymer transporter ExbD [Teredinibacter haidensis]